MSTIEHLTTSHAGVFPGFGWGFQAGCRCGWSSDPQHTRDEAWRVGDAHLSVTNIIPAGETVVIPGSGYSACARHQGALSRMEFERAMDIASECRDCVTWPTP